MRPLVREHIGLCLINTRVINWSWRLVFKTCSVKCTVKFVFGFQPSLENQKDHIDNQKAYIVSCTGKFVFGFQDDLCSLGLLEKKIKHFCWMRFWDPNKDTKTIVTD